MDEGISATHSYLLANYGPLLTLRHLAELLHTTPNGIRMAIARQRQPLTQELAEAKRPLGRRIYFDARRVAAAIDRGKTGVAHFATRPHGHLSSSFGCSSHPAGTKTPSL